MPEEQKPVSDLERMLQHSTWLRPLARGLVGDDDSAEDVLQETWITAWRRPPRDPAAQPAWLRQVMQSLVRMKFRGENRRQNREHAAARPEAHRDELALEALELRREIVRALLALDEPFRSTLILRYYEDLSSAEIARLEGIPAATVRVRLKRGLDRLREQLDERREDFAPALLLLAGIDIRELGHWAPLLAGSRALSSIGTRRAAGVVAMGVVIIGIALVALWSEPRPSSEGTDLGLVQGANRSAIARGATDATATVGGISSDGSTPDPEKRDSTRVTAARPTRAEGASASGLELGSDRSTASVTVRVVDSRGRPIPGARVAVGARRLDLRQTADGYASTYEFLLAEPCPDILGTTSADGTLRVDNAALPDSALRDSALRHGALAVSAAGHRTARERPTHREFPDGTYTVTLGSALETTISIESESGAPIPDGTIEVLGRGSSTSYTVTSDAPVRHVSHDDVEVVRFLVPGYAAVQDLLASPHHHQRLPFGEPAHGRVVDPDGQPVVGASVSMRSPLWRGPAFTVRTELDGTFHTFGLAPEGELELEIVLDGSPRLRSRHALPCTEIGLLRLERSRTIEGQVLTPDGIPCPGAQVLALPDGPIVSRDVVSTETDDNGVFRFDALSLGTITLRAESEGYSPAEQTIDGTEPMAALRLGHGRSVAGRVVTPAGEPVAGVPIRVGTIVGDVLRGPTVSTDRDGRFRIDRLPPEAVHRPRRSVVRWRALDPNEDLRQSTSKLLAELFLPYQLLSVDGAEVERLSHFGSRNTAVVEAGSDVTLVIAEPTAEPPVEFVLTDRTGARVRAISNVLIVSPHGWTMKDFAGMDGRPFHLPNPHVLDDAQLTIMSRGYSWQTVRVDLRGQGGRIHFRLEPEFEQPPRLRLDPPRSIELLVAPLLPGPEPIAALPVGQSDVDGERILTHLGPGRYALCIPRDSTALFAKSGKRRLALPMDEVRTVGHFEVSAANGQTIPVRLDLLENTKDKP